MNVELVTPWAGVVALAALVPLAGSLAVERRAARVREAVGLDTPRRRGRALVPVCAALVIVLLALAASQPVLASHRSTTIRQGADVFVVLDTSRSMVAARTPGAPNRFERARGIAHRLIAELPAVPVGLASLTDRVLPHVFPTASRRDLDGIERVVFAQIPQATSQEAT